MNSPAVAVLCTDEEKGQPYADVLAGFGASPILVPSHWGQSSVQETLRQADGLLITGGGDICPCQYGQKSTDELRFVNANRDALDRSGVHFALDHPDLPVLGICRGIQTFNVFAGGDLIQHIPAEVCYPHAAHLAPPTEGKKHAVRITRPDSLLAEIIGSEEVVVNSYHHQAVKTPARDLIVTAKAPDGVIEAMERPAARWTVLVQWHPERMLTEEASARRLFEAFVAACSY